MVVLFPSVKDQEWRWRTTNNEYGNFYSSFSGEALGERCRVDGLHSECNRKCEELAREVYELRSELDNLRVSSRLQSPRFREGCRDPPHHNGDCMFSERARIPCDDMFHTTHDIEYNGGRRTEPQVLEDHLRADHPRLVKKVAPLNPAGASCFDGIPEQGGAQSDRDPNYGRGKVPKYWTGNRNMVKLHSDDRMDLYRRPDSPDSGGFGASGGDNLVVGEQTSHNMNEYRRDGGGQISPRSGRAHHHAGGGGSGGGGGDGGGRGGGYYSEPTRKALTPKFPHARRARQGGDGNRSDSAREKILPPSQRYNFYRYYGFAGQGAKTSRGLYPKWHRP